MTANILCAGCTHAYADNALFCPNCGRPKARDAAVDPLLGKLLGERFMIQARIGQGGSGTIYRAEHVTLRRKVAIKVLHDELSRDDLAVERFRREATTVAEIDNEHIVEIHDFGRAPDGRLYLAMELLEGETLDAIIARDKQLTFEQAADVLIQLGEALMEAHAIGYVHRDLRPRNVYLAMRRGKANFVKLLDFGLAKLVETDASAASTSLGMTFGDPRYMSPEQARGDRIDRRADIYQLGCVAYEMLTGAPPFTGNRVFDILTKQVTEAPVPLPTHRRDIPLWMEAAVTKMLAKDPENRFATTSRMVEALRRGLSTGEVMDDEVARTSEAVPPASVSRTLQKLGMAEPALDGPPPTAPAAAPAAPTAPAGRPHPAQTARGIPAELPTPAPPVVAPVTPAPVAPAPAKADSVELLRKRTGTPRLGVPVAPPAPDPSQAPVAGVIDKPSAKLPAPAAEASADRVPASASGSASASADKPSLADKLSGKLPNLAESSPAFVARKPDKRLESGVAQSWYEDEDADRARKTISPSTTDVSFYDDYAPPRRRWGVILAGVGLLAAGGLAIAMVTRTPSSSPPAPAPTAAPAIAAAPVDAAPSTLIEPDPAATPSTSPTSLSASAPSSSAATPPSTAAKPAPVATPIPSRRPTTAASTTERRPAPTPPRSETAGGDSFLPPGSADPRRPFGGPTPVPPAPPTEPKSTPTVPSGPSGGVDGPLDPYGNPASPPAGADPAPGPSTNDSPPGDKQSEFFANLGAQQLAAGETATAASNFRKALELDARSVTAILGMGEIAIRQGLFPDALVHLKKGVRLAPRNAKAFTLLGEAHLAAGSNPDAATAFKRALQIDPDNARARDGYNEASSRAPDE